MDNPRKSVFLIFFIFSIIIYIGACDYSEDDPYNSTPNGTVQDLTGGWHGVTDTGGEVYFEVIDGKVENFELLWNHITGTGGWVSEHLFHVDSPMTISDNGFSYDAPDFYVTGSFNGFSNCSGTWSGNIGPFLIGRIDPRTGQRTSIPASYGNGTWTTSKYLY